MKRKNYSQNKKKSKKKIQRQLKRQQYLDELNKDYLEEFIKITPNCKKCSLEEILFLINNSNEDCIVIDDINNLKYDFKDIFINNKFIYKKINISTDYNPIDYLKTNNDITSFIEDHISNKTKLIKLDKFHKHISLLTQGFFLYFLKYDFENNKYISSIIESIRQIAFKDINENICVNEKVIKNLLNFIDELKLRKIDNEIILKLETAINYFVNIKYNLSTVMIIILVDFCGYKNLYSIHSNNTILDINQDMKNCYFIDTQSFNLMCNDLLVTFIFQVTQYSKYKGQSMINLILDINKLKINKYSYKDISFLINKYNVNLYLF